MDYGVNYLRYSPHLVDNIEAYRIESGLEPRFSRSLKQEREQVLQEISNQIRSKAKECFLKANQVQHLHAIQLWLEMEHGLRCERIFGADPNLDGLKVHFIN